MAPATSPRALMSASAKGGIQADHRAKIRYVAKLEQRLGRELHLVAVGGARFVPELEKHLTSWTIVDSTPYMRSVKGRRRATLQPQRVRWAPDQGAALDELLAHNITEYHSWIDRLRMKQSKVA